MGRQVADVRTLPEQFVQQLTLAWLHGISPAMYYQLGIVVSRSRHAPTAWLQDGYAGLLSRVFRDDKELGEINDKAAFGRIMARSGIPYPETVVLSPGSAPVGDDFRGILAKHRELFLKRSVAHGGKGSRVLIKCSDARWSVHSQIPSRDRRAPILEESVLIEELEKGTAGGAWLVQPRLGNHPLLARLFGPGLVSVRVVSARSERNFVLLGSLVSFAAPGNLVSQRGLKVGVEIGSGRMGQVFRYSVDQREHRCNPHTGQQVEGVELPYWKEVLEMIGSAHAALPGYPFLGWDVAICPTGPVMLEANGNFGVAGLQRPPRKPLIDEGFLRVFDDWDAGDRSARR